MRIAIYSSAFAPSLGGVETIARILAEDFTQAGHEVVVVTETDSPAEESNAYQVKRRLSAQQWWRVASRSDATFHMNVSLRVIWANLLLRKPTVVVHHGRYFLPASKRLRHHMKEWTTHLVTNVAVSQATAAHLAVPSRVIPNCYDDRVFRISNRGERTGITFVGRLVSEKKADVILRAMSLLRSNGLHASLTIIGEGPERPNLQRLADTLNLGGCIRFLGAQTPNEIAAHLNEREIVVVPSEWEGFGLVALEAIACGCIVVGSNTGGLPEAIGQCGLVFDPDEPVSLSEALKSALSDAPLRARLRSAAPSHLARHSRAAMTSQYLEVLESISPGRRSAV